MSRFWRMAPWTIGLAVVLLAGQAVAQGNLDAGKTPAQIFADTCAGCHRSPGQVRRASASFLRSHYTTGSEEASAMARYLANVPNEPRPTAAQQKKGASPKETRSETATARRGEPKEQAKGPAGSSKGRRAAAAEAKSSATASAAATPEPKPPEPPAETVPPPPPLEPFEE